VHEGVGLQRGDVRLRRTPERAGMVSEGRLYKSGELRGFFCSENYYDKGEKEKKTKKA
jgi:hypothetical protein